MADKVANLITGAVQLILGALILTHHADVRTIAYWWVVSGGLAVFLLALTAVLDNEGGR